MNNELCLLGKSSSLYDELLKIGVDVKAYGRKSEPPFDVSQPRAEFLTKLPLNYKYYCINIGHMSGQYILDQTREEIQYSIQVNLIGIIETIEYLLLNNDSCRILIIGSESAEKGSYDTTYFLSKSAIRQYVLERSVSSNQQLLMVSPSTIRDGGMTVRRNDTEKLKVYEQAHPKKRFLNMQELALFINDVFIHDHIYLCNEEIRLNGGKFARMKYNFSQPVSDVGKLS